jgi:hypothetical protein
LDQQRIGFHDAERADALRAEEHALGVEMHRAVILERAEDDALLAIDRARRHHHRAARMLQ